MLYNFLLKNLNGNMEIDFSDFFKKKKLGIFKISNRMCELVPNLMYSYQSKKVNHIGRITVYSIHQVSQK